MKYSLSYIILISRRIVEFYQYWKLLMSKSFFSPIICNKKSNTMYTFRPYELVKVNYKCYKGIFDRGINSYPRPRSGHRIVCNDSDLYCFGGFNPNIGGERARGAQRTMYLFQELWKFDLFTKKWNIVYSPSIEGMPEELASNAVILRNNMLIVKRHSLCFIMLFVVGSFEKCAFVYRYLVARAIRSAPLVQISATC